MGRDYSRDLRDRVQAHIDAGHGRRDAARRFGVSPSFAVKLAQRVRETGSTAPARQGRPRGRGKLAPYLAVLIGWVEAEPDITMPELAAELLAAHGISAHPASLSRALCAAGFSYEKTADGGNAHAMTSGANGGNGSATVCRGCAKSRIGWSSSMRAGPPRR